MGEEDCIFENSNGRTLDPWCVAHQRSAIRCLHEAKDAAKALGKIVIDLSVREPTPFEGDRWEHVTHADGYTAPPGECFVPRGGWTGRRCRRYSRWTWGGPTVCKECID